MERACALLQVSRSDYYRPPPGPVGIPQGATWLQDAIEQIVLEFPGYGYRRVTKQLQRDGWNVNHKRVLRLMREESLLCQLHRRWVKTTDSEHGMRVYPNLLKRWKPQGLDQVWVADITYIRLPESFAYLAAILDAFSRRVVGGCLSRRIDSGLALDALDRALTERRPPAGWIHHSDRGVQYACRDYVKRLQGAGARISMSAKGTPRENAQAESFFRTLKHEEVYLQDYQTYAEVEQSLCRFINDVYNEKRLHSSLGYRPPSEFEQLIAAGITH
ncbi:MAG: IS3 family transposase [Armatimonadetes bacterium]|nr:IS3 family transposase [Armatimonadota bacterium]